MGNVTTVTCTGWLIAFAIAQTARAAKLDIQGKTPPSSISLQWKTQSPKPLLQPLLLEKEAEPQAKPASDGAKKGGGRNEQKSNPDRVQSAQENLADLKQKRDALKSQANKTPEDKAKLEKLDRAINRQNTRIKKSETHPRQEKGS